MSAVTHLPAQAPAPIARQGTPQRWQRASERAKVANVIVTPIDDDGVYQVTSASHPGVVYFSDGLGCSCPAYFHGDPVCLHRAAVRDHQAAQVEPCRICGGTGWEHFSIWDWRNGCAVNLYTMRCSCQHDPEPEPPAPAAAVVPSFGLLEQALANAQATLNKIDDQMVPFTADIKDGDGSYTQRNGRRFDRLQLQREIAQHRVWDAQDALDRAQKAVA